jgi:ABC-type glutathione transport system ATPase component
VRNRPEAGPCGEAGRVTPRLASPRLEVPSYPTDFAVDGPGQRGLFASAADRNLSSVEDTALDIQTATRALTFQDIGKRFPDGTHALTGVSLDVGRGEFVCVVGPSGCGKSTLLRLASGLSTAPEGRVEV